VEVGYYQGLALRVKVGQNSDGLTKKKENGGILSLCILYVKCLGVFRSSLTACLDAAVICRFSSVIQHVVNICLGFPST